MKHVRGAALPLGVTISEEKINFSVAAAPDSVCELCLYKKGYTEPFSVCELEQEPLIGNVRFVAVEGLGGDVEYLYRIDGVSGSLCQGSICDERPETRSGCSGVL